MVALGGVVIMKLKKLLSIILSPLVLGSYSSSAVRRIPNVVKDRVLKRENRNLSPKRKRSRRKKNKVVNHKVDKKKLKNRTKGKSPLVNFRDSFIKDSKRIWRSIKKNPGKSYEVININNKDNIILMDLDNDSEVKVKEEDIIPIVTETKMKELNEAQYTVSIDNLETTDGITHLGWVNKDFIPYTSKYKYDG